MARRITPASITDEAEKLYPYDPDNDEWYTDSMVTNIQRSAHITCAGMYPSRLAEKDGEITEAVDILKALVALKKHKDTVGKDEYYEKAQPEVWKIANKFLDNFDKK